MEVIIQPNPADVGRLAADVVVDLLAQNPRAVLGVATGSSPLGLYAELARRESRGQVSFAAATAFALDEYVGIPAAHPESYHSVIRRELTEPLNFREGSVHVPSGEANDLAAACRDYELMIRDAGGIDLQVLGIGSNGHIGFNEPTSSLSSRTRVKTLARQTLEDNARFFDASSAVPVHCVTQGIGTIMEARHILLLAHGRTKAQAVAAAIEGPVTSRVPGSALQHHPQVTVLLDEDAAAGLELADYYRHVGETKSALRRE